MPLGEDVNNNSIVNESVDNEGHSDSPACLPGLSHLRHRLATDLPVHAQPTGPASEHTQDQRDFTANGECIEGSFLGKILTRCLLQCFCW